MVCTRNIFHLGCQGSYKISLLGRRSRDVPASLIVIRHKFSVSTKTSACRLSPPVPNFLPLVSPRNLLSTRRRTIILSKPLRTNSLASFFPSVGQVAILGIFSCFLHHFVNMFRRQLLRQARACRGLRASPSSLLASGSGLAPRTATTCKPAILTASISRQIIARTYSSATAAAEADNGGNSNGLITRFADLSSLGVDDALISAITKGMGYEKMTDVQAMSINPALQGKDL